MNRHMLAAICVAVVGSCAAVRGQHGADFVVDSFAPDSYIADDDIDILPDLQEDLSAEEGNRPRRYFRTSVGQFFVEDLWSEPPYTYISPRPVRIVPSDANGDGILDGDGFADHVSGNGIYTPDGMQLGASDHHDDLVGLPVVIPGMEFRDRFLITSAGIGRQWFLKNSSRRHVDDGWIAQANAAGLAAEIGLQPAISADENVDDSRRGLLRFLRRFSHRDYFGIGLRYVGLFDSQDFALAGNMLEQIRSETEVRHTTVGPQLSLGRVWTAPRTVINVRGSIVAGYGHARFLQDGALGAEPPPDQLNRPLFPWPVAFRNYSHEDYLSTYAELDTTISYFFTSHWSVDATARLFVVDRHYDATDAVDWTLPYMGIVSNPSHSSASGGNLFVGVTRVW